MSHTQRKRKPHLSSADSQYADFLAKYPRLLKAFPRLTRGTAGTTVKAKPHNTDGVQSSIYIRPGGVGGADA